MKWLNHYRMKSIMVGVMAAIVLGNGGSVKAEIVIGGPVNAGPVINTSGEDAWCDLSADGLELYFIGHGGGIVVARRETTESDWLEPERLMISGSNPAISPDGLELYFHQPSDWSLWIVTRPSMDESWGEPMRVGPPVGDYEAVDADVSADGLSLYFASSDRPGGYGGFDIWVATRTTRDSEWGEPVHLGPNVNSSAHDWEPAVSADGLALIFARGGQLWATRRRSLDDEWEPSAKLEFYNNWNCFSPTFSPDSSSIFFNTGESSLQGYGDRDIWEIEFTPNLDLNKDRIVDLDDMLIMLDHWNTDSWLCDISPLPLGDGFVDVEDLKVLVKYLLPNANIPTLIAHWPLDETEGMAAGDVVGNNYAYVLGDAVWQPESGQVDGALLCDGVDDFIATRVVLNPAEEPFSILAWIKGGAPGQVIVAQQLNSDWLSLDTAGSLITHFIDADGFEVSLISQTIITDERWHHVGLVWDGSRRMLCVDGEVVAEDTQTNLASSEQVLYIGCGSAMQSGTFFSGLIDDVRIYNGAVSPQ